MIPPSSWFYFLWVPTYLPIFIYFLNVKVKTITVNSTNLDYKYQLLPNLKTKKLDKLVQLCCILEPLGVKFELN